MYTSENNWYSWSYDNVVFGRQTAKDPLDTHFGRYNGNIGTFKNELLNAARSTMDHCNSKPVILFSGGADSEIVLRAFLGIGVTPDIVIARYENDYNIYDVSYAITICSMLNVPYKLLDLNLKKFYENDAERLSELAQIDRPRALPHCKLLEMVDGFPIMGGSDLTPYRTDADYSKKGTWLMRCWEYEIGWSKLLRAIDKPGAPEWFKWTPGLVMSCVNTTWFHKLVNDEYYGHRGPSATKIIGYREAYPNLIDRKKQTGFEHIDSLVMEMEQALAKKYNGLPYRGHKDRTITELCTDIIGHVPDSLSKIV
jgi:hypothetical protein